MTEVDNLREGVYVSRTLLPDRFSEVPVRILNVSGEPIHLRAGSVVSELHPVDEVLSVLPSESNAVTDPELEQVISDMVDRVDPEVPEAVKRKLKKLIHEFKSAFSKNLADMGLTSPVMHRIDTGDAEPARQALRRQPKPAIDAINQLVPEMLSNKSIEPSVSPWAQLGAVLTTASSTQSPRRTVILCRVRTPV